jgi:N-acetylmuramoyl-L-alanine amidase
MTTAKKLLNLAAKHIGEQYVLGSVAPKSNFHWRGPWVYQTAGKLFGTRPLNDPDRADAYTGFWAEDARKMGKIISVGLAAATPGAFVLRLPGSAVGHIAISTGDGGTIEAHSSARGVVRDRIAGRRWDLGVLVPGIATRIAPNPMPVPGPGIVLRVKEPRMTGKLVRDVQRALAAKGFNPGPIDGEFGSLTAGAVRAFQLKKGLAADGEVGTLTAKALKVAWI